MYIGRTCKSVMIDKRKVRLMTRAAIYEKEHGEEDLKIAGYYKKDYTSLNTWVTLIWVTAGFILLVGVIFLCYGEDMMEGLTVMRLLFLAARRTAPQIRAGKRTNGDLLCNLRRTRCGGVPAEFRLRPRGPALRRLPEAALRSPGARIRVSARGGVPGASADLRRTSRAHGGCRPEQISGGSIFRGMFVSDSVRIRRLRLQC